MPLALKYIVGHSSLDYCRVSSQRCTPLFLYVSECWFLNELIIPGMICWECTFCVAVVSDITIVVTLKYC